MLFEQIAPLRWFYRFCYTKFKLQHRRNLSMTSSHRRSRMLMLKPVTKKPDNQHTWHNVAPTFYSFLPSCVCWAWALDASYTSTTMCWWRHIRSHLWWLRLWSSWRWYVGFCFEYDLDKSTTRVYDNAPFEIFDMATAEQHVFINKSLSTKPHIPHCMCIITARYWT